MKFLFSFLLLFVLAANLSAQSDSLQAQNPARKFDHRDSLYMVRLNNSGNLMLAGGIGLCGAGSYLIYQGHKIYTTPASPGSATAEAEIQRNHRQGTIYYAAGGIAIAGGIILTAFGARNKVDFVRRKKMMSLQSGILDNGNLGMALSF